ncbi:MAG: DNA helicase UvrD [Gammaproteobacteria bacterium]|nr:MAG: DNA helicase UvrD [Gammaproteobacteria bacterium]
MNLPLDYQARQAALNPARSFAVSAPAGSGKTGLLTQRLLKLLSLCENPEEVLAITFTKKAAGEMQDRVLQALWAAREQPQPESTHDQLTWTLAKAVLEQDQIQQWNLLQCPQRLRIQTIDSLCASVSRQLPIASGFGSQPKPGTDAEPAYRKAVHHLFNELESESPVRADLSRLLEHLDNNIQGLEELLIRLLAKRDQWLGVIFQAQHANARKYLEQVLKDIIANSLMAARDLLQLYGSELATIADWAATNLVEAGHTSLIAKLHGIRGLPATELDELESWIAISELLLTGEGSFRKALNKLQGFPAAKENKDSATYKNRFAEMVNAIIELRPDAADIIHELRSLPPAFYDDKQWSLLESLTRLLPRLAAILDIVFAEQGETDFSAVSQAALKALGDEDSPTDIALQLDYRIQHILVDEFQDTSTTQLQLLERLTAGWEVDDGRTLFIVGDGMQSCYSFRNANVGIFLEARAQGIRHLPLEKLDLTVNFRSQSGIVNWVNRQFQDAFPAEDDISRGAVTYSASNACKPALEANAVEIHLSAFTSEKDTDERESNDDDENTSDNKYIAELHEAEAVARLIKNLRENNPEETVALLARSRTHLQHIFPAMSRLGLSWQATEIDSLAQRMAITDLTSLTRALLNPADRIAWLAILRAPWCGLDLKDLHAIANTNLGEHNPKEKEREFPLLWQQIVAFEKISSLSTHGKKMLEPFRDVIQAALQTRQRKPLRQWIEGVWLALGGPATLLDPQNINDIPNFFNLLDQHQQAGTINDWQSFNRAVKRLYALPHQDADAKLQVMTMHKSKGLEFDHVIIPGLHKLPPNEGQQLLLWRERLSHQGERQLLLGPLAPVGGEKDQLYAYMKKETALQLEYEAIRLFYVGCTRAIRHLYLFGSLAQTENGEWKNPPKKSLLSSIWENVKSDALEIAGKSILHAQKQLNGERPGLQHIIRLSSKWKNIPLEDNELLKIYRGKEMGGEENIPVTESRGAKLARHTGSLIHRALQNLVGINNSEIEKWQNKQLPFWKIQLQQNGWHNDEIERAIKKILFAIHNTLNDEHGKWLLNNSHEKSECELVIVHKQGNNIDLKLRDNIIDRSLIDDGVRWIIDYKSSEPALEQPITDFLTQEIAVYKSQLDRYKACFEALGETNIKLALYFPLLEKNFRFVVVDE